MKVRSSPFCNCNIKIIEGSSPTAKLLHCIQRRSFHRLLFQNLMHNFLPLTNRVNDFCWILLGMGLGLGLLLFPGPPLFFPLNLAHAGDFGRSGLSGAKALASALPADFPGNYGNHSCR